MFLKEQNKPSSEPIRLCFHVEVFFLFWGLVWFVFFCKAAERVMIPCPALAELLRRKFKGKDVLLTSSVSLCLGKLEYQEEHRFPEHCIQSRSEKKSLKVMTFTRFLKYLHNIKMCLELYRPDSFIDSLCLLYLRVYRA